MAKGKLLKAGVKKLASFGKKTKPYAKFKSKQAEIAKRKAKLMGEPMPTKAAKKPGFKTGVATGVATTAIASKITGDKVKKRSDQVKKAADESYKKQKEKQKKYREKKGK
jgi:uncharacterized protein with ATP-grasp and redox domains